MRQLVEYGNLIAVPAEVNGLLIKVSFSIMACWSMLWVEVDTQYFDAFSLGDSPHPCNHGRVPCFAYWINIVPYYLHNAPTK
jgi:hypothetical protein